MMHFFKHGNLSHISDNSHAKHGFDIDELIVSNCFVDEGPTMKRMRPRAKGRGAGILKRSSHITVAVSDEATANGAN